MPPIMASVGPVSVRAYGMFGGKPKPLPVGTVGMFAKSGAQSGAAVNSIYTYAGDVVTAAAFLTSALSPYMTSCSNKSLMYTALATSSSASCKYMFPTNTSVVGQALYTTVANSGQGASIGDKGLLLTGNSTLTMTYTYSTDITTGSNALSQNMLRGATAGNATYAIVGLANSTVVTNKFVWATEGVTVATSFKAGSGFFSLGCGTGNANMGIFGQYSTSVHVIQKYLYAGETTTIISDLALSSSGNGASGNQDKGVITIGSKTNIYNYANDAVTAGPTMITVTNFGNGMAGTNGVLGVTDPIV